MVQSAFRVVSTRMTCAIEAVPANREESRSWTRSKRPRKSWRGAALRAGRLKCHCGILPESLAQKVH